MSISSPILPPPQASAPKPLTPGEGARIILESASPAVTDEPARQTLKGTVTGVKPDGTVQVQTEKGAVEILIPPESKAPRPQPGDRVEIDVKPEERSSTPREVNIRVTERAPAETRSTGAPAAPPRTSDTPVELRLEPPPPPPPAEELEPAPRPDNAPLVKGAIVRLQPLPPELLNTVKLPPAPEPEEVILARLTTAQTILAQALPGKIEALADIPLRPILSTQSEIRVAFLQAPPATITPKPLPQTTAPAALQPVPAPSALLPGLPLAPPDNGTAPPPLPALPLLTLSWTAPIASTAPAATAPPATEAVPLITALPPGVFTTQNPALQPLPETPGQSPAIPLVIESATLKTVLSPLITATDGAPSLSLQISGLPTTPPLFITAETAAAETKALTAPASPAFPENPAAGITRPHARANTLIAKVSGLIKGDTIKGDIPVVKLDNVAPPSSSPGQPVQQPLFILHMPEPGAFLPVGTELALSAPLETAPAITAAATLIPSPAGTLSTALPLPPYPITALTPQIWPTLDQIYQGLTVIAPQTAMNLANVAARPDNPAQMIPAALFFIAAIRAGDVQGWLGEKALDSLKTAGKSGLLSRLIQEGGALSRLAGEPLSGDWRGVAFPLAWQNEIHKIALYYKQEEQEDSGAKEGMKGTRFIMDLTLTQIGRVQLDGYCRGKSFDLILRTDAPFSAAARQSLRTLYHGALEWERLSGDLAFQSRPEQWVKITGKNECLAVSV